MPYVLYNLALYATLLLGLPVWAALLLFKGKWRSGIWERLGRVPWRLSAPEPGKHVVWVHAVSVGEVLAAVPLIRKLDEQFAVFVSTTTKTGQELARARFGEQRVFYFPADFDWAIAPYVRHIRPDLVVLMETEFWPNFLRLVHRGSRVAVVNARISDRSLPGYKRWGWLVRRVLDNVDAFCAQSEEDARRIVGIGADRDRVHISGNVKFDWRPVALVPELVGKLRDRLKREKAGLVIVAGSTVEEEEEFAVGRAFTEVLRRFPRALLVVAPRHPERFDEAAQAIAAAGLGVVRRSEWKEEAIAGKVLLLDTIGELAHLYALADIAIVAGSFVPRGGHNVLEPAYFGKPIIVGPHTENFRDIIETFKRTRALVVCETEELQEKLLELAQSNELLAEIGDRAKEVMNANTGATERTYATLMQLMEQRR